MLMMSAENYLNNTHYLSIKNHFISFQFSFNVYLRNNYENLTFFFTTFFTLFSLKIDGHLNDNKKIFLN